MSESKAERKALENLAAAICALFETGVRSLTVTTEDGKVNIQTTRSGGGHAVINGKRVKW